MRELTELKGEPLGFGGHVQFQTAAGKESRIEKAINITDECTKVPKVFKVHIFYIRTEKEGMGGLIVEIPPDGVPDTFVGF
ncbi:MAG: hypothetical protein Q7R63_01645, partial [bacterium]|nr:hypothetical protein [bacterium]